MGLDSLYWAMVDEGLIELPENWQELYKEFLASSRV